ncbi:choice-of-anchor G family protein [Pseudokineococcus sp. 5B2Z-1]|uniref:choice-of-anchor G family protein n=1 Tax=Pseudokineococcus sp. 5B2Z-1 TaxID=3132744 RepID=UPI0030952225
MIAGAGALAVAVALLPALGRAADGDGPLGLPALGLTDASWLDTEHVRSELLGGARDCDRAYRYASRADARMLSGTLLGADLSPVVALSGVTTQHTGAPGTSAVATPSTAPSVGPDAHAAPLSVTALSGVASGQAASVVVLPAAGQEAALLNQTAYAASDGEARSAAGAVTDAGAVSTTSSEPNADGKLPGEAVVDLDRLGLPALAKLRLQVGALSSAAVLDGCLRDEKGAGPTRDYRVAALRLRLASPQVEELHRFAGERVGTSLATVAGLQASLAASIGPVLGGTATVAIGTTSTKSAAELSRRLGGSGPVVVDLARGAVEVDLERLLASRGGLNGQPPGTEIVDQALLDLVAGQVDALLQQWLVDLAAALTADIRASSLSIVVRAPLTGTTLLSLTTTIGGFIDSPGLLAGVASSLNTTLFTPPTGVVPQLVTAVGPVRAAVRPATAAALAGVSGALSLRVNDRRDASGVHDVSALRIRTLAGPAGSFTDLRLATSSVGPVVEQP